MQKLSLIRWVLLAVLLVGWGQVSSAPESVELGRSIYERGIGRDGREITARVHGSMTLKGGAVACGGCHGKDGYGGGEAFVRVPDIRWISLSRAYPARRTGFVQIPYDPVSFARVLRSGIASSERKLDAVMPRFDLADDEMNSLIAFLKVIDHSTRSQTTRLQIVGLLPVVGQNALADELGLRLQNCAVGNSSAPIASIDTIYFKTPEEAIDKLDARLGKNNQSVILAPFLIGWENRYVQALRDRQIDTVLPLSLLDPPTGSRWLFPFPGLESQILALIRSVKADGFEQLHIHYEPDLPLSVRLYDFVQSVVPSLGLSVITQTPAVEQERVKTARLWLKPVDQSAIDAERSEKDVMLAPVLFFAPKPADGNPVRRVNFPGWRIAYPYQPEADASGVWSTPVEIWAKAACEFLAQAGAGTMNNHIMPENLQWGKGKVLHRLQDLEMLSDQVFIDQ